MILFDENLRANIPLGTAEKLMRNDFDVPMSFIYGDHDWATSVEEDIADVLVASKEQGKC